MSKVVQSMIAYNHSSIQTKNKSKDQQKYHHVETEFVNYGSNRQATKAKAEKLGCQDGKRKQMPSNAEKNKIYQQLISKKNMDHIHKKQAYKTHAVKRPQTPDPLSTQKPEFQNVKYPQPELILKEIEKNVNFLKQMYYASLSQQNSLPHKNSGYSQQQQKLAHSQSNYKQIGLGFSKDQARNSRKSFDVGSHPKKSVPQISIVPTFQPYSTQNTKNFNSKIYQQFIGTSELKNDRLAKNGKLKQQLKQKQKSKQKSKSGQLKQKEKERRKSSSNLHKGKLKKNIIQSCNNQEQISNKNPSTNLSSPTFQKAAEKNGQKGTNINSLFEIFKYYKRSIDSSLSKRTSASHVQAGNQNYQRSAQNRTVNVYISNSNKNQSSNQERSYGKQTPNNSTTKNTTNHKDSTISRNYGSSIDPSIQVSIQQKQDNENENENQNLNNTKRQVRKSSKSNSTKKDKSKKTSLQSKESRGKRKNNEVKGTVQMKTKVKKGGVSCNILRQDAKETCKNYVSQLQSKKIKQDDNKKKKEGKQRQKQSSLKAGEVLQKAFKKKGDKKTSALNQNNIVTTSFNTKTKNYNNQYHQEEDHRIEFPQIQSSLFDRNMPILEQDSREEASSEFIAVTGQKNQQEEAISRSAKQESEANESLKKTNYWIQNKQNNMDQFNRFQRHQACENVQNIHEAQVRIQSRGQGKRIHTPPYLAFEAQNSSKQPEIPAGLDVEKGKQEKSKQTKKSDDSLAGFEIPKRDSESDLDNFELVSFEL